MLLVLQIVLGACYVVTGAEVILDVKKNNRLAGATTKMWVWGFAIGIIANLLDTLGCGSFAPTTAGYKMSNTVDDIDIPGTLNVGDTFPVIFEAFIFTASVNCDPVFLIAMLVAAAVGSFAFANIVTKWPRNKIRWALGIVMPCLALVMLCKNLGVGPFGTVGTEIGFAVSDPKFWVCVILNVLWGALMDIGFGLYAPCMATCLLMGIDAGTCFPVFMGSCALLMPVNSVVFIKTGRYDAVATIGNWIGGMIGVFIAWKLVTSLPMFWLINLICVVLLWTSYSLISAALKDKGQA